MDVLYVRSEATADASLAAILERSKFGIAIAAMIRMIATTINNSISEKPFCCFFICPPTRYIKFFFGDLDLKVRLLQGNRPAKTGEVVAGLSTTNNSLIFMRLEAVVLRTFTP